MLSSKQIELLRRLRIALIDVDEEALDNDEFHEFLAEMKMFTRSIGDITADLNLTIYLERRRLNE